MSDIQQSKNTCPNGFYYTRYGKGYLVFSDAAKSLQKTFLGVQKRTDRVFTSQSGKQEIEDLCAGQKGCKPATCEYKQELFRALHADSREDPKQHFKK